MGSPTVPPSAQWLPSQGMNAPNSPQPLGGTTTTNFQAASGPRVGVVSGISDRGLTWLAIVIAVVGLFMNGRRS